MFDRLKKLFHKEVAAAVVEEKPVPELKGEKQEVNTVVLQYRHPELSKALENSYTIHSVLSPDSAGIQLSQDKKVYIYTLSRLPYEVDSSITGKPLVFDGVPEGSKREYHLVLTLANPYKFPFQHTNDGTTDFRFSDARRVAQDIIDPDNLTLDQNAKVGWRLSDGRNLGEKGLFWSEHNPPLPSEVKAARTRMIKFYTKLLRKAGTYTRFQPWNKKHQGLKNERALHGGEFIGPEHHAAADYFGITTVWHPTLDSRRLRKQ